MKVKIFILLITISLPLYAEEPSTLLTWETAKQMALRSNRQLSGSLSTLEAAKHGLGSAQSKEQFQLEAQSSISASKTGTKVSNVQFLEFDAPNDASSADLALQLSQVVWDGGKLHSQTDIENNTVAAKKALYNQDSIDVRQKLNSQFLSIWYTQKLLELNESVLKRREKQLKLIENRYKVGLENLGSLLTTQANVEDAKFQLIETNQTFLKNKLKLSQLVATDLDAFSGVELPNELTTTPSLSNLQALAMQHPKVQEASFNIKIAQKQVDLAKAQYAPDVTFTLTGGKTLTNPVQSDTSKVDAWVVKLSGTQSIWDNGDRENQIKKAQAQLSTIALTEEDTLSTIITNLRIAYIDWITKKKALSNRILTLSAIQERAEIMQVQYESGLMSFNDWSLIEDKLIDSQKAVLLAQLDVYMAWVDWHYARGGMLNDKE